MVNNELFIYVYFNTSLNPAASSLHNVWDIYLYHHFRALTKLQNCSMSITSLSLCFLRRPAIIMRYGIVIITVYWRYTQGLTNVYGRHNVRRISPV